MGARGTRAQPVLTRRTRRAVIGFGADFATTRTSEPWISECDRCNGQSLCEFDSDGDGVSNGMELGDPCCLWTIGSTPSSSDFRTSDISHPGFSDDGGPESTFDPATCAERGEVIPRERLAHELVGRALAYLIPLDVLLVCWLVGLAVTRLLHRPSPNVRMERLVHAPLGPALRMTKLHPIFGNPWLQTVDFLAVRDFVPELLRLTPAEVAITLALFVAVVVAGGMLAFGYLVDRNIPGGSALGAALGHMANWGFVLTCLPVSRNSIWTATIGLPFERALKFHRWAGRATVVAVGAHFFYMFISQRYWPLETESFSVDTGANLYGTISFCLLVVLLFTSVEPVRRRFFELFYYVHYLFLPILVFACLHSTALAYMMIIPAVMYAVDWTVRLVRGRGRGAHIAASSAISTGEDKGAIVNLTVAMDRMFHYRPGGYVWLSLPAASLYQWLPFSITSRVDDRTFTLNIKTPPGEDLEKPSTFCGRLAAEASSASLVGRAIYVDGPYGKPSLEPTHHAVSVFCAGGIGVTPMLSMLQAAAAHAGSAKTDSIVRSLNLVWTIRDVSIYHLFLPLLRDIVASAPPGTVHLYIYHTRAKDLTWVKDVVAPAASSSSSSDGDNGGASSTGASTSSSSSSSGGETATAATGASLSAASASSRRSASARGGDDGAFEAALLARLGRPKFSDVLQGCWQAAGAPEDDAVAVFSCGPAPLIDSVHDACRELSDSDVLNKVLFAHHMETFEF